MSLKRFCAHENRTPLSDALQIQQGYDLAMGPGGWTTTDPHNMDEDTGGTTLERVP